MPALYSHTTRASGTVLTAAIYNGDHENHITNGVPAQLDDYSVNATEMRLTNDPGEDGAESLATSLGGELERLRFAIAEAKKGFNTDTAPTRWYSTPSGLLGSLVKFAGSTSSFPALKRNAAVLEVKTADDSSYANLALAALNLLGGQIAFPATQNASADANTLDDYEEGTFTPTLTFGGAAVGMTFTTQFGRYEKHGRTVLYRLYMALSAKGSSTGAAIIGTLPFVTDAGGIITGAVHGEALSSISGHLEAYVSGGGAQFTPKYLGTGTSSQLDNTNFNNNSEIAINGSYNV